MILLLVLLLLGGQNTDGPVLYFFYRPSCGNCMDILLGDVPKLQGKYEFELKKYDIDLLDNYQLLEKMEQEHDQSGEELPVVFINDSVFYGPVGTFDRIERVLRHIAGKPREEKQIDTPVQDTLPTMSGYVQLYYFYQPGCKECGRLDAMFNSLQKQGSMTVNRYNISEDTNKVLLEAFSSKAGMPEEERLIVPAVFLGSGYLIKQDITTEKIFELAKEQQDRDQNTGTLDMPGAEKNIVARFDRFSLLGIMFAGLLDGVNPCAFATIVFFVSYLLFLGRRRRDIMFMAVSFIAAVFFAYFLIGVGAYNILNYLAGYEIIAEIIFICFGILALILGVLSMRDFVYARQGKFDKMLLQLPLGIKQRIHRDIKKRTAVRGIVLGSFIAGLVVSFLEFGCTGQIYLPTITFMVSKAGWRLKPLFTLLIYNIMFVLPLILISLLAAAVSMSKISKSIGKRIPAIKLLTAFLFFALGVLLILSA
jgi:cytochrome c biogenesis protein CcdA/thiol-disulfide isomerase/thioredoxin